MAAGTITAITEDVATLAVSVNVGGAIYTAIVSKPLFDALPTDTARREHVISLLSGIRRTSRQHENTLPVFIGAAITIPD